MLSTLTTAVRPGCGEAQRLVARLVGLIEGDRLSVAAAARESGVALELAAKLVQLHAIELEAAESLLDERLEDIERQCPREDWWSYSERGRASIFNGTAVPNRIVRELVQASQERTGRTTSWIAAKLEITPEALRRSLGMVASSACMKKGAYYPPRRQKTLGVDVAARVVRAIGIL